MDIGIVDPNATAVRVFLGGYTGEAERGACIDFAYFAIVDDWSEIEKVAGEGEQVIYTAWSSTENDKILNSDGTEIENN